LDDDVERAARALARAQGRSIGKVISDLARASLAPQSSLVGEEADGFPVFAVSRDAVPITPDMVADALDE
jgi:hypothetical protein